MAGLLHELRSEYHQDLCRNLLSFRGADTNHQILNIADKGSKTSVDLSNRLAEKFACPIGNSQLSPQALGERFPKTTMAFLSAAFELLQHLRPGNWEWSVGQARIGIAAFDQYEHLAHLQLAVDKQPELKAALGADYLITPDLVVSRTPVSDIDVNQIDSLIGADESIATLSPLRRTNRSGDVAILHASISCKWTMRSDRAQNTRTEALNLIRNRKGGTPHIMVVTFEPLPTRLASIAMGTGDVDCTYHVALHELLAAAADSGFDDQKELLADLINGNRLRDISDLPFDLAV
jgi:hypothetical protein